jgi:uncharacterized protein (DUF58 family)
MTRPRWDDPALAAALADLPLSPRRAAPARAEGRHAARFPGNGHEFAQYRGYLPGDDLRRVDWKLLARSDRFYVREADAETALPVRIVLDGSASMAHAEGGRSKWDAARALAAALARVAIRQGDVPALAIVGDGTPVLVQGSHDRRQLDRILDALARAEPQNVLGERLVDALVALGHGPLLVITDAHDPGRLLPAAIPPGDDATFLVLRSAREQEISYGEAVTLEDLETGARVTVRDGMAHHRAEAFANWNSAARDAGAVVVTLDPFVPLAPPLRHWLAARAGRA